MTGWYSGNGIRNYDAQGQLRPLIQRASHRVNCRTQFVVYSLLGMHIGLLSWPQTPAACISIHQRQSGSQLAPFGHKTRDAARGGG